MPYKIKPRGNQFCVIKETDGTSMGCHDNRREALAQLRALYANEPGIHKFVNEVRKTGSVNGWITREATGITKVETVTHAGLAVKALDTGRILMLQRSFKDSKDPAKGTWEFPGGKLEEKDMTSLHGAIREWEEEVGQRLPSGGVMADVWTSPDGKYVGHLVTIPKEEAIELANGHVVPNPDDPDGDDSEQAAWWEVRHAKENPALRKEVKNTPWDKFGSSREIRKAKGDSPQDPDKVWEFTHGWKSVGDFYIGGEESSRERRVEKACRKPEEEDDNKTNKEKKESRKRRKNWKAKRHPRNPDGSFKSTSEDSKEKHGKGGTTGSLDDCEPKLRIRRKKKGSGPTFRFVKKNELPCGCIEGEFEDDDERCSRCKRKRKGHLYRRHGRTGLNEFSEEPLVTAGLLTKRIRAGEDSPRDPDPVLEYSHGWIPVVNEESEESDDVEEMEEQDSRESSPPLRPVTDEDRKVFKVPPAWTDVMVAEDTSYGLLARGRDAKGRVQSIYSSEYMKGQAQKKFERIKELSGKLDDLDAQIAKDIDESEEAAALSLIRTLGMRPGSNRDTRAAKKAYGATTLLAKHVRQYPDTSRTTFSFTGKKGVPITVSTTDPQIYDMIDDKLEDLGSNDRIFDTTEARVLDYFQDIVGEEFKVKDLRTLRANVIALQEVAKIKRPPKTKTEYKKRKKAVAEKVSKALGNTPTIALASYINPTVFHDWQREPDW